MKSVLGLFDASNVRIETDRYGFVRGCEIGRWKVCGPHFRCGDDTWRVIVECQCGTVRAVCSNELRLGRSKSCGCLIADMQRKHGEALTKGVRAATSLYHRWCGIKARCHNEHSKDYKFYGAKGVRVCEEWLNSFESFRDWATNNGYKPELTIDRIDPIGNYEPNNCRWIELSENVKRKRHFQKVTPDQVEEMKSLFASGMKMKAIGEMYGVHASQVGRRIRVYK